ncbi:MAG: protein phosphatase 2C domain-containing protein [Anaerolineales bacterium]|nr:protein phosphatase 2C domain-containing protein [Anaerolineales bacterium]
MFDFLKKWLGQIRSPVSETLPPLPLGSSDPDATVPLPELGLRASDHDQIWPRPSPTRFTVGLAQHVGQVRTHNEDVLLAFTGELRGLEPMPHIGLFVVADGMGGHSLGERASGIAGRTLARVVLENVLPSLLADPRSDYERPSLTEVMELAIAEANRTVVRLVPEGGTTLTGALIVGDQLILCHVGDTRAYVISDGKMEQLTRDHSLVQRLKEMGQLTDDEAAVHPQRSVLYRAIGQGEGLEADVISRRLSPGTILIVCSDGLWSLVPDHIIHQIIRQSPSIQDACEALVHAANEAGGPDNITVVIVQLPG